MEGLPAERYPAAIKRKHIQIACCKSFCATDSVGYNFAENK